LAVVFCVPEYVIEIEALILDFVFHAALAAQIVVVVGVEFGEDVGSGRVEETRISRR